MKILLVDDDQLAANLLLSTGREVGLVVTVIKDGPKALELLVEQVDSDRFDVVILSSSLPGACGRAIVRAMRKHGDDTPVMMLAQSASTQDRVAALHDGADDHLLKPFDQRELLARLQAIARRRPMDRALLGRIGNLEFDVRRATFRVDGEVLHLTPKATEFLERIFKRRGAVVPKESLMAIGATSAESVDTQMSRLRRRLQDAGCTVAVRTVHGEGYILESIE